METREGEAKRVGLAHLPTPLEPLNRLSAELGGPRIWVKRDDCTGLAGGGNKTRTDLVKILTAYRRNGGGRKIRSPHLESCVGIR